MRTELKRILAFVTTTTVMMGAGIAANADTAYIKEVQGLLDTLSSKDPARVSLTLKLADAQFEEYLHVSNQAQMTGAPGEAAQSNEAIHLRHETEKNYHAALTGFDGLYAPVSGSMQKKVRFQLARLYNDDGKGADAEKIWQELVAQDQIPDLKRESALRLAENAENRGGAADLANAEKFYKVALGLCAGLDVCSYSHYRLGWVYHRANRDNEAVTEIKQALWDSKGQVREEALRDMISFIVAIPGDGKETLTYIEDLSNKIQRKTLVNDLAEAYFAAGNRVAGTYVLENANRKNPTLKNYARLLEEQYGFRNWTAFNTTLEEAAAFFEKGQAHVVATKTPSEAVLNPLADADVEKILRRLTVQLDGERTTQTDRATEFKKTVLFYLSLFPNGDMRSHMIEGWIASETNVDKKLEQLAAWISNDAVLASIDVNATPAAQKAPLSAIIAARAKEEVMLREKRAAIAQNAKRFDIVMTEMAALRAISTVNADKKREYTYQEAKAAYDQKDYNHALPLFVALANVGDQGWVQSGETATSQNMAAAVAGTKAVVVPAVKSPDKWAILSENLALDIYAQKKDYANLVGQAQLWTKNAQFEKWVHENPTHAEELHDLTKIAERAQFEQATALGETPEALKTFMSYCKQDQFLPKSCDNAKVLAVKLKDEETLIAVLKKQNATSDLTSELEGAGYYVEAATLLEGNLGIKKQEAKNKKTAVAKASDFVATDYLKVALLYELGQKNADRDRILRLMTLKAAQLPTLGAEEDLIYTTLADADLLTTAALKMHWKKENRSRLIGYLEEKNLGDKETHQVLVESCENLGPAWTKMALTQIQELDAKQKAISFYGKNSKRRFEARLAGLKKLVAKGDCYLQGADAKTRVIMATLLAQSHNTLADEIKHSPIPDGLSPGDRDQLISTLTQLAEPFVTKAKSFEDIAQTQLEKVENPEERMALKSKLEAHEDLTALANAPAKVASANTAEKTITVQGTTAPKTQEARVPNALTATSTAMTSESVEDALAQLHKNPEETSSLQTLKSYYENRGQVRLAAYYEGRLLQIGKPKATATTETKSATEQTMGGDKK